MLAFPVIQLEFLLLELAFRNLAALSPLEMLLVDSTTNSRPPLTCAF
jgi:hypothetical protein